MFKRVVRALSLGAVLCGASLALGAVPAAASSGGSGYYVTFVARSCPEYTDIFANRARNDIVESLKDLGPNTQYGTSGGLIDPYYEDLAPQTACTPIPGWEFTMGTSYKTRAVSGVWGSLSIVGGVFPTSIVTKASTPLLNTSAEVVPGQSVAGATTIELTDAERQQASGRNALWAQGGTPTDPVLAQKFPGPQYGFGSLRCATDNLNGDNVEYIYFPSGVRHVFCYGYYVEPPPTTGVITIKKQVIGAPDGTNPAFPFSGSISFNPNGFRLSNGGSMVFYRAGGSTWNVTEGSVPNYSLDSLSCQAVNPAGGPGDSTFNISGSTAAIHLTPLEHVTCVYTNRYVPPPGGLTITKITDGGVGSFSYAVDPAAGGSSQHVTATTTEPGVPADAAPSLTALAPGHYTINEQQPSSPDGRWHLDSVVCDGTSHSTTAPVKVTVSSGAEVTCVFTNRFVPRGEITLAKITKGATGTAGFEVTSISGTPASYLQTATTKREGVAAHAQPRTPADATDHLELGSYRIYEESPASDSGSWALTEVACNGEIVPFDGGAVVVKLTASRPAVHCVYTDAYSHKPPPKPPPDPPGPNPSDPSADLVITKHASPTFVSPGAVVTYRITVTNRGPDHAEQVEVGDQRLGSANLLSVHSSVGQCSRKPIPQCSLGTLNPGAKVHITVRMRVTPRSGSFSNRAVVGSATTDPKLADNAAHATVGIMRPPPPGRG